MMKQMAAIMVIFFMVNAMGQLRPIDQQNHLNMNDTILLEDVTISILPFGESYQEATGGVFLVRSEEIDLKFSITSTDMLNLTPGIHMASGSYNTNRLVIRGIGSRTPYNTNRIRAYLDDIPLTTGDGISTLEDIDLSEIGHMEIIKGPSSALYGSGLGGIVRLNSPYPTVNGFSASLSGEIGSFNTSRYGFKTSYKNNRMAITGGITSSHSDGYRENSDYSRSNAFLNTTYFGNRNTLSFTLSIVDLFARIPSSINESDFLTQPEVAAGNWLNVRGFEEYFKMLAGIKLETDLNTKLKNHLILFSSYADPYESRPFNILDDRTASLGFREYLQYEVGTLSFSAGLEYFHEWYNWKIFETDQGIQSDLLSDHDEIRKYANTFALVQWRPTDRILIDGGVNLNTLHYSLQTNYQIDSTDQTGSYSYPMVLSPRIGISYKHHKQHHLYASAGHGFSAPSLEETLLPEGTINTELKPESGWNLEIGNRGKILQGRIRYDATLYTIFLNNLLVTERIAEDIFTGANAGKALNSGLELWTQISLLQVPERYPFDAKASIGYTLSNNRFIDFVDEGIDYSGNLLPGIPSQKLNSILTCILGPVEMKLHYQYTGSQWMNDANDQKYEAYQLLNLQVSWKHNSSHPLSFEVHGGIRNLFNTRYASMILVNAPSFGGNPPRYYYPGLPRQFHLGITFKFR
ncbi:MAG: TonB-dependent receptor [Bacteroidota bacterium]